MNKSRSSCARVAARALPGVALRDAEHASGKREQESRKIRARCADIVARYAVDPADAELQLLAILQDRALAESRRADRDAERKRDSTRYAAEKRRARVEWAAAHPAYCDPASDRLALVLSELAPDRAQAMRPQYFDED